MGKPPETTHFARQRRRAATCGFSTSIKAVRVNSLAIAAGGLQTKGRLSFRTGIFDAIEFAEAIRRALWDKTKTQRPEFKVSFRSCPGFCPRSRRNTTWRYLAALDSRQHRKLDATGMTGRQNRSHGVGVKTVR